MKKTLPLGIMDYRRLKDENYYAVDKTLMIQEFLQRQSIVTLITRPRRFGKTLNMSMMAEFFDITKDSKDIFQDTKIMDTEYVKYMNQYPTIFITFANAKGSREQVVKYIKLSLRNEYERYDFIFDNISMYDQNDFHKISKSLMNYDDGNLNDIDNALSFLMKMLEKYYHQKVMLFIDEYDTPFIEAHVNGFYGEIRSGLASMLHNALKLSSSLQYAILTGIQRVAKENIFSDLNNLVVCTVVDQQYDQYFGFTEEETKELLKYYDLELNDEVKNMYDGYHIGKYDIYNPWSIINYADNKQLTPYWVNTSANLMIRKSMKDVSIKLKESKQLNQDYDDLIMKGQLSTHLNLTTSFYESPSIQSLWGLFVNAGYLTVKEIQRNPVADQYILKVPNGEVMGEFKVLTADRIECDNSSLENMFIALLNKEVDRFMKYYQDILLKQTSSFDLISENSYHMFMLGLMTYLQSVYSIKSNREAGKGRYDILMKSTSPLYPHILIELKKSKGEDLAKLSEEGMKQIREKKYDSELTGEVLYISVAYEGKELQYQYLVENK